MAQGTITRLTYERLGILLTDAPAYKENGTKYGDLIRVQSMDYGFSHQAIDIKQIGSDGLVVRGGQSPVVRSPDVNCNIEYIFAEGQNESKAGLYIGKGGSVLKNLFDASTTDDINVIVVASDKDSHRDINLLKHEADFEDYNVIGIGNAFLTSYSYSASVGSLPKSSITYSGSNLQFDIYKQNDAPTLPAIKLGVNNQKSTEEFRLRPDRFFDRGHTDFFDENGLPDLSKYKIFSEHHIPEISTTKPGDIKVEITKKSGGRGGAKIDSLHAAIQNISINMPIPRQDIFGMGSNYVFNRKLQLPIIAEASIDMVFRGYDQDQVDSFLTKADVYDLTINHPVAKRLEGYRGEVFVDENYFYIAVDDFTWRRTAFTPVTRSVSSSKGATEVSSDGNFYYVCINGNQWGKIVMSSSSIMSARSLVLQEDFVHVNTPFGWRKFAVSVLNFDIIETNSAFQVAQGINFEINSAQLKSQNYTHSIGSDVMVSSSLSFPVDRLNGLKLFFN